VQQNIGSAIEGDPVAVLDDLQATAEATVAEQAAAD
jgi:hypothetical protein